MAFGRLKAPTSTLLGNRRTIDHSLATEAKQTVKDLCDASRIQRALPMCNSLMEGREYQELYENGRPICSADWNSFQERSDGEMAVTRWSPILAQNSESNP